MADPAAVNRPPNCRLFLGNLASEKTSRAELMEIFGKYGNIVEEIVLRRSFGFIQYDTPEAAVAALNGEQGRSIGGLRLDISLADNREPRPKKRDREERDRRGGRHGDRDRDRYGDRRDDHRDRDRRGRDGDHKRSRFDEPPGRFSDRSPPQDVGWRGPQVTYSVVYLGLGQRAYANSIRQMLEERLGLPPHSGVVEATFLGRLTMDEIFTDSERRGVRYVLMVSGKHERTNTVDVHLLQRGRGKSSFRDMSCREAIDIITQAAAALSQGTNAALAPGFGQGPAPTAGYGYPPPAAVGAASTVYGNPPAYSGAPAAPTSYTGTPAPYAGDQQAQNLQSLLSATGGGANLVAALASLLGLQGQQATNTPPTSATSAAATSSQYNPMTAHTAAAQSQHQLPSSVPSGGSVGADSPLPAQLTSLLNETNLALLSSSVNSLLSPTTNTSTSAPTTQQPSAQQPSSSGYGQATGGYAAYGQQQQYQQSPYQSPASASTSVSMYPSQASSSYQPRPAVTGEQSAYRPTQQPYNASGSNPPSAYGVPSAQQSYGAYQQQQQPPTQGWGQAQ